MRTIIDKNYGADIDGNRGTTVVEFEIDDDDFEEICDQILDAYPDGDAPRYMTVSLYSDVVDDYIDMEINTGDYL